MRSAIIIVGLLLSGWANALTLSPMYKDDLVYQDMYIANLKLENTDVDLRKFTIKVRSDSPEGKIISTQEDILGGEGYKTIKVPIYNIKANKLHKYYICVTEQPKEGDAWGVVGRVCAKVRLYWPLSELQHLE